jgi:hypothetical protein
MKRAVVVCAVLLGCVVARPLLGQIKAEAKARSDHYVTVRLSLPDKPNPVEVTVQDGTLARVRRMSDGATIAIAPRITDLGSGAVAIKVFGITILDDGSEMIRELEMAHLNTAQRPTSLRSEARWSAKAAMATITDATPMLREVTLLGVDKPIGRTHAPQALAAAAGTGAQPNMMPNQCCLNCDGWEVCGCAVWCAGNYCCVGLCCD